MNDRKRNSKIRLIKDNIQQFLYKGIENIKQKNNKWIDALCRALVYSGKSEYKDFTPEKEIKNGEEYLNALDWALRNPDIKNIALSGPYGSGKSSIIQSYKEKHPSVKALNISLATFDVENCRDEENIIEEGILKQLFYKVDAHKIPQSRYRKLKKISIISYARNISVFSILLIFICGFFLTDKTCTLFNKVLSIGAYWGLGDLYTVFFVICVWMASVLFLAYLFRWITKKFSLKEINLADKAIISEGLEEDESIFNKNMDEIVYFFEETKYDTVFIEDLDRFKSTEIFIKLRELNTILNNYEQIKNRIAFIYAIRDDIFVRDERTKFFDFIIPVIPIINSTNSGEILREKLNVIEMEDGTYASSKYDISSRFITLISPFIEDMRVLTSICNEFVIYKKTLRDRQNLSLKDELMFSMMIFKNLYPKDFADLEAEKGIVKKAFNAKKNFINNKILELEKEIELKQILLDKIDSDVLRDLREVKIAFINYLVGGNEKLDYVENANGKFTYSDIMKSDFDIKKLDGQRVNIYYVTGYDYYSMPKTDSRTLQNLSAELKDMGNDYFKRCEVMKNSTKDRKDSIKKNIENCKKEISYLRSYTLPALIKKYSSEVIFPDEIRENKLLVFLIRHGYIDENYAEYINYFHPKSITKDEMNFILGIRNFEPVGDFSYTLKHCGRIMELIEDYEFSQPETLNFNLLDYMILQEKKDHKYDIMLQQIVNHSAKGKGFIKAYLDRGLNLERFVHDICRESEWIWYEFLTDNSLSEDTKYKYLEFILCYADITDIKNNNGYFDDKDNGYNICKPICSFMKERKDTLQRFKNIPVDRMMQVIETLGIYFKELDIEGVDKTLLEYVFDNQFFELTHSMLGNLFKMKKPECIPDLRRANYKMVRSLGYEPLNENINSNFPQYVQTFILDTETNTEEDFESVNDIIENLFKQDDSDRCLQVIDKEPVIWENLENCCADGLNDEERKPVVLELWNYILMQNRTSPSWYNYSKYRDEFGVTEELVEYLDTHMDNFIMASDCSMVNDSIMKEIIVKNISLQSFVKLMQKFQIEDFTNDLNEFTEEKVKAMIAEQYFPFSAERYVELREAHPNLCIEFICKNKEDFMECIDDCGLMQDEIVELLKNNSFSDDEKIKILNQIESAEINERIAWIIRQFRFRISKEYVEAAWRQLSKDDKYELLLNHIGVYSKDELAVKFQELGGVYQQLASRTRHKVSFHDDSAGYNKRLLDYLNKIDYLSSVKEEDVVVGEDIESHKKIIEHIIIGMVKQAK
ncbi:MAG: hypothetical protein HFG34_03240 [Eubacterium sp.]|nr:hypothetical protein [Eubacterium sp.]